MSHRRTHLVSTRCLHCRKVFAFRWVAGPRHLRLCSDRCREDRKNRWRGAKRKRPPVPQASGFVESVYGAVLVKAVGYDGPPCPICEQATNRGVCVNCGISVKRSVA